MKKIHDRMSRRILMETLKSEGFITTDEIVRRLREINYFDDESREEALLHWEKTAVRRLMRQTKDDNGQPIFANVEIANEEGGTTNGYMQEALFDVSHYRQVIDFHNGRAFHHIAESKRYANNLNVRYDVQVRLPFEEERKAA